MPGPIATAGARGPLDPEARAAVRNASFLMAQRALDLARAFAFAAFVPRLLGPADFGRFALLASIAHWFALVSGLGSTQLLGRFVPVLLLKERTADTRRLLGNLLAVRCLGGTGAAVAYLALVVLWFHDLPLGLLLPMAAGVAIRSVANVPFAFFLGLNQAARWGAGEVTRRWSSLLLVGAGAALAGVGGACLGVALAEVVVLAVGLRWARAHVGWADVRVERAFLAPFLRFNLAFFGSNLLSSLAQRAGEPIVRAVEQDYVQVGYFGIASGAYVAATHGLWQVLMAFLPLLSRLRAQGRPRDAREWAARLLKVLGAAGAAGCLAAWLLGPDAVRLVAGPAFAPAGALLLPVAFAILVQAFGNMGRLLALVLERPRISLAAVTAQTVVMFGLGVPMAARFGAWGVAVALAVAGSVQAGVFFAAMPREMRLPLGPASRVLGLALVFVPIAWVRPDDVLARAALLVGIVLAYAGALWAARLVTREELAALRAVFSAGGDTP